MTGESSDMFDRLIAINGVRYSINGVRYSWHGKRVVLCDEGLPLLFMCRLLPRVGLTVAGEAVPPGRKEPCPTWQKRTSNPCRLSPKPCAPTSEQDESTNVS